AQRPSMSAWTSPPKEGAMAMIRVIRPPTKHRDRARKYELLVDGSSLAKIGHGETVDLSVGEGRHAVQAKIDWATTSAVEIDVRRRRDRRAPRRPRIRP